MCLLTMNPALPVQGEEGQELASPSRRVSAPEAHHAGSATETREPEDRLDSLEATSREATTLAMSALPSSAVSVIVVTPADSATARPHSALASPAALRTEKLLVFALHFNKETAIVEIPVNSLTLLMDLPLLAALTVEGPLRPASPSSAGSAPEAPPAGSATSRESHFQVTRWPIK